MRKRFLLNLSFLAALLVGWDLGALAQSTTFSYTGSVQTYTVPAGVTLLSADVAGAQGGNYTSPAKIGGRGGRAQGSIAVTPGQVLYIYVGQQPVAGFCGSSAVVGGTNSGGGAQGGNGSVAGGCGGAGGGGASDIRTVSGSTTTALNSRLLVGAGGGGSGYDCGEDGGHGGGLTGGLGNDCGSYNAGSGGGPGTQTAGGAAGSSASAGGLGFGGAAYPSYYGGGGGGGYYGGGGAYAGSACGGSSYIGGTGVTAATTTTGFQTGNGYVVITPALPTVIATPTSLAFGAVTPSTTSSLLSFTFTGLFLTASSSLTITAPANYEVSLDGSTWGTTATYSYTGTAISTGVAVLVRFTPPAVASYTGNITITGGGLSSAVNVAVSGNGAAACSASPSTGTAGASPASGNASTSITLTLAGASTGGGIAYQWQSSPDNSTWSNIAGAATNPYVFTGLSANTYFRCVTTCPSFGSANSTSTLVTFTLPGACTPTYGTTCASFAMPTSIASLVGVTPTSITDPSTSCGGTGANYQDKTGTMSVTLYAGSTYTANIGGNSYAGNYAVQIWIDFNDNGTFSATESIGGGTTTSTATSGANPMSLVIPSGVTTGTHRMRIVGNYSGCCGGTAFPTIASCPTSSISYGETRDYKVVILNPPATATSVPSSLAFGPVSTTSATTPSGSVPPRFVTINATALVPAAGLLTLTPPTGYQLSNDGVAWTAAPMNVLYSGAALSNRRVYVRFIPATAGASSANLTITGGGLAAAVNIAVTGTGTSVCSGTPTAGTAAITPASGNITTNFTLSLTGSSASGGLAYQWQRSVDGGTTWVNMQDGLYTSYTFTGIFANAQFRCVVTCSATGATATTAAVSATFNAPTYCAPAYGTSCAGLSMPVSIANLVGTTGAINDPSSTCGSTGSNYTDRYASTSVTLAAGATYTVSVGGNSYWGSYSHQTWIDYNDDGVFTASESVGGGLTSSGSTTYSGSPFNATSFVIPTTAVNGTHRMRMVGNYSGCCGGQPFPSISPCITTAVSYGETRDYKVTITGGVAPGAVTCSGTPAAGITSAYNSFGCSPYTAYLFNTGESVGGFSYNWQMSSTSPTAGYTSISGATNATYFPSVASTGTFYYRNTITCGASTVNTAPITVVLGATPNISSFTSPTATNSCSGSGSVVTVNSTSLGAGSFTVTYNLSGANTSTGNTATLTMGAATGTFTIPAGVLASAGATTVTLTQLATASGCTTAVSSSNTASFNVGNNPNISVFTAPSATNVCMGFPSTVTVNSTSLGSGTLTATYNLSGANTSTGNTAVLTMGASNGTFTVPGTLFTAAGATTVTITSLSNGVCSTAVSSSNTASVTVSSSSVPYSMTGGGSYCTGGLGQPVGISTSSTGNTYQLYNGAATVGSPVAGTGSAISFGTFTATGSYSVLSTNTSTGCTRASSTSTAVSTTSSPTVYTIGGGGSYCAGAVATAPVVYLTASDAGATYQLYNGVSPMGGIVTGTGLPISFGVQTLAGTYYAIANPGAGPGCQITMGGSTSVAINALPTAYGVTGGGNYCTGAAGVPVGLGFGTAGVTYNLMNGAATATTASGANAVLSFGNITATGTYSVLATNSSTGCTNAMVGTVTVGTVNPAPAQSVTGGGSFCSGGAGVAVGLGSSTSGVSYQLYNGGSAVGSALTGTGSSLAFGNQTANGVYTVLATVIGGSPSVSCTAAMTGSATVIQNPTPTVFTVSGGGAYCAGTAGSSIGLNGTQAGVNYTLYNGGTSVTTVAGTGSTISFGTFTATGTYTVLATNASTACTAPMSGSAVISINALPSVYSVGGGGSICNGAAGLTVTLSGTQTGVNYTLYRSGTAIAILPGTGISISYGPYTDAGLYTIIATNATTGCTVAQSGSTTIVVNPLPTVYNITGGGNYCAGSTGVAIGLSGSQSGVTYSLYNGATLVTTVNGTSSPISFGIQTVAGTFSVYALTTATGCTNTMSGAATIAINPLPTAYAVSGTGNYCAGGTGVTVCLASSASGVTYNLYNGAALVGGAAGTGSSICFGNYTTAATYTVAAVNTSTGCTSNMSGSAVVGINALPTLYTVTSSGASYCAGGAGIAVGLTGSDGGASYQLYMGSTPSGSAVTGTGSPISFGNKTAAGTYTVVATSAAGCIRSMSSSATIAIDALPTVYAVTSTGTNYCAGGTGITVGLTNSESGVNYQLYNGAAVVGTAVPGTGSSISFGTFTAAGTYTVLATNTTTTCSKNMSGAATISINSLPIAQTVTSSGTNYCAGTAGISIGLTNSATGINYQLYNGVTPVGVPVPGTGAAISLGTQTAVGTYMILGTNVLSGCSNSMTGTASISVNPAPSVYAVTGGGSYCNGSAGVSIGISGSNTGINYQLYNGSLAVGSPVAGTGTAIDFGTYTTTGTYYVTGVNAVTGCSSNMSSSASVSVNALPVVYNVTGGGNFCNGGTGVHVGLSSSTAGISYQLYLGGVPSGSAMTGTGLALDFGIKTAGGIYTVIAFNPATSCTSNMSGTAVITVNSLPVVYTVTGGGSYCNGTSTGVSVGLGNSAAGVSYQLYNGSAFAGTAVLGTGAAIDFGSFTGVGTYSVLATSISTGCQNPMSGTASISINALPVLQSVTGGGTICQGSTGANVFLNNSQSGINYQLYNGPAPVGGPVSGTGSTLSFGAQTAAGTYTVLATNATTSCSRNMIGTATINVNAQPALQTVTGGGNYCAGDAGSVVGLSGSATGVNYQLYNGATPVGTPVAGTGSTLAFGTFSTPGTYSVMGANALTGCSRTMSGSTAIGINPLPTAYTLSGGGNICSGNTTGVVLSGSNNGITYQLYNGTTAVNAPVAGNGGPLTFGALTDGGSYMVTGTNNLTGCTGFMTGTANVTVNMPPVTYVVTGGGDYCAGGAGVEVGLSASNTGVSYQLYKGGAIAGTAVAGTGGEISFGNQFAAGTYSVLATSNSTSCTAAMGGSATVGINALPSNYTVTGGGTICAGQPGVVISINGSTSGVEYQLMNGTTPVGFAMLGTGSSIDFAPVTNAGTYMVVATDPATTCSKNMSGSATVNVNALPTAQNVTGGGNYCSGSTGVVVGLAASVNGVNYQLMNGATAVGTPLAGNGASLSFGAQSAGAYSVLATNATTGCANAMTGTATVVMNTLPSSYTVITATSSYCAGGEGVHILLSGSASGVNYQLYRAGTIAVGTPVPGTGGVLDFGAQTTAGNYTVMASDATNACSALMTGGASVVINPLPTAYNVTGGGGYCSADAGAAINLNGSNSGISYQLYNTTTGAVGAPVSGTGGPITFGAQPTGTYMVIATNTTTSCTNNMNGTAASSLNPAPATQSVLGGGAYCAGGTGVEVSISGSQSGVAYQLFRNGNAVGVPVAGTGTGAISFGLQTAAGTYTVFALNTTTNCTNNMTGSATVSINTPPATFAVNGGGNFCAGGAGVNVGLAGSATGVNYQLYKGGAAVSGAVLAGTGSALDFGAQTASGSYNVIATSTANGCTNVMTGAVSVNANALPTAHTMTGGGSYCATPTATGVVVGLNGSENGISYQLYKDGTATGTAVAGTGGSISFGNQLAAGNYTAMALNTTSTCSSDMAGSSVVVINPPVVPTVSITSAGGNTVCLGVLTTFTASNTNAGIAPAYQWKVNGSNVGLGSNSYAYVPNNGDVVSVSMTSSEACAVPATVNASVTMTVSSHQMPTVAITATPNDTVCAGTTVTYTAAPQFGGAAPSFIWKKNGVNVGSGSTYAYVPSNNDVITCEMTSNFPCRLADVATSNLKMSVETQATPVVAISANPGTTISAGQTVTLTASASNAGNNPSYKWLVNSNTIVGATNASYTSNNFANNDEVTCEVTSNGACLSTMGYKTVVMKVSTVGVASVGTAISDIKLLPNPNKGDFMIRGTIGVADDKELSVEVADMLGQIVYRGTIMARGGNVNEKIQISNTLANGMYLLNLRSETETKVFHFILQQ
jgi:hypothetical protein